VELEETRPALEKTGRKLAAISYDTVAILASFSERRKIGFPLLSDEGSAFIRQLGLFNEKQPVDSVRYGVPHPGAFMLDGNGKIISKSFEVDARDRETLASILSSTWNIGGGLVKTTHETKHLTATTSATNALIRPFQVMRLQLDVRLKRGMHVYAPGVTGYQAIAWELEPSPAFTARRNLFPPGKQLHLRAIQETVPVYDGEFRVQMEVAFPGHAAIAKALDANGQLRVAGAVKYQACDAKQCYLPVTVPVSWAFQYENLEEPRVPEPIRHQPPTPGVKRD
jgi:hypothetical protein